MFMSEWNLEPSEQEPERVNTLDNYRAAIYGHYTLNTRAVDARGTSKDV